ncbi:hypothetical protein [Kitasatospora purpeofusca]|uniref:hypothetical protein n=1 Tax=Kitasatospora purpeofusca TaxID=67352 RepID=UPI0037F5F842
MTIDTQPGIAADPVTVETYLASMFADLPGLFSICSDADRFLGRRFSTDPDGIARAVQYVLDLDKSSPKGIYAQVTTLRENPRSGRGGENLAYALSYLWADGDFGTTGHSPSPDDLPHPPNEAAVRQIVADSGLPVPSGWAHSGGGLNPVWMLSDPYVIEDEHARLGAKAFAADAQAILGAAAYRAGCTWDVGVGDLARLMRLPGTVNRKTNTPRPVTLVGESGVLYAFYELAAVVAELAPAAHAAMDQAAKEKQERAARRNNRPMPAPRRPTGPRFSGSGPLDVLADMLTFADVLQPLGWTFEGRLGDGREKWLRAAGADGKPSSAYSLVCDDHVAVNWSDRSDLPVGALPTGRKLTVGTLYAYLHYGGDVSATARDIMRAASGKLVHGPARALPVAVLAEVGRRCLTDQPRSAEPSPFEADEWAGLTEPEEEPETEPDTPAPGPKSIPGLLPEEFYAARPVHQHIRAAGHSRNRSGDVAFLSVLVRLSAMVSHHIRADTGVAGYASLNLFGGIIGPSGIGKSTGADVADRLMPAPAELDFRDGLPIGSGEGIAEIFMDTVDEPTGELYPHGKNKGDPVMRKVRKQVRHNAFFWVDEGVALTRLMKERSGSTLGETLRSAAVGQTLGQTNASKDTTRYIPAGSYSTGLLVGFQPETAAPLFEEVAEGTPQRFWWTQVLDPSIPDEQPAWPGELSTLSGWRTAITASEQTLISFDPDIKAELRRADLAKARGEVSLEEMNPLDSHAPLMQVKFASLLALLDGRRHVTTEDWQLTQIAWQASCAARDSIIEYSERQRKVELERLTQARIVEAVRIESAKANAEADRADQAVERLAHRLVALLDEKGAMTRSAIRDRLNSRQKKHLNDAIAHAQFREWVTDDGKKVAPGPSRPR